MPSSYRRAIILLFVLKLGSAHPLIVYELLQEGILMLDIKSELGTKLPQKANTENAPRVQQAQVAEKTAVKTGVMVILSAESLKKSRELKAIQSNPDLEPQARAEASDKLRRLALKIYGGG